MALTRQLLKSMGIEEEKIDQIIEEHRNTVDEIKTERDDLKDKVRTFDSIQKQLEEANEALKSKGDESEYKAKYDTVTQEFEAYKKQIADEKVFNQKKDLFTTLLKSNNFTDEKGVRTILNSTKDRIQAIELTSEGKIKDEDKLIASIVEDFGGFQAQVTEQGANTPNPPGGTTPNTMTREQIDKIADPIERQKAMKENINLYIKK